jgi:hypothetical protein
LNREDQAFLKEQGKYMSSSTFLSIERAIRNKQIVCAMYQGHYREMCPHTLGWSKIGKEHALLYQFAGSSKSGLGADGSYQNWRCVDLDELTEVVVKDGSWHTAANHSRKQTCVARIAIEVMF